MLAYPHDVASAKVQLGWRDATIVCECVCVCVCVGVGPVRCGGGGLADGVIHFILNYAPVQALKLGARSITNANVVSL